MKTNILAVGAHPDDVELGALGSLIRWSKHGKITLVVVSNGENGYAKNSEKENERVEEAKRSARACNAEIIFLGLNDGSIPNNIETVSKLDRIIRDIKPDRLLVHHPDDVHQDHRNVALSTISAARRTKEVLFYETPSTTRSSFQPNFYVNISLEIEAKLGVLQIHKSQRNKDYFSQEAVFGVAAYHALSINKMNSYYEAFQVYRYIVE